MIEVDHLRKGYGDRLLIEDLTFSLPPGRHRRRDRRQRRGQDDPVPDADRRRGARLPARSRIGSTVQLAYVDQSRDTLDADKTVYEEITGGRDDLVVGGREIHGRAYVASFNFKGSDQQKTVGVLSGGERNRVHLAKVLKEGGNVLLLDEPTNDLDVDTLRALEDGLEAFAGCAVVISHDRWFLDRVATHILAFEGDSQVRWFEGNFSEYEAVPPQGARRRGRPAAPHQVQAARAQIACAACRSVRSAGSRWRSSCSIGIPGMIVSSINDRTGAAVHLRALGAGAVLALHRRRPPRRHRPHPARGRVPRRRRPAPSGPTRREGAELEAGIAGPGRPPAPTRRAVRDLVRKAVRLGRVAGT